MRDYILKPRLSYFDGMLAFLVLELGGILGNAKVGAGWAVLAVLGLAAVVLTVHGFARGFAQGFVNRVEAEDRRIFSSSDSVQMQLYVDDDDRVSAECPACGWVLFQGELSVPELVDASLAHRKGCVESA